MKNYDMLRSLSQFLMDSFITLGLMKVYESCKELYLACCGYVVEDSVPAKNALEKTRIHCTEAQSRLEAFFNAFTDA